MRNQVLIMFLLGFCLACKREPGRITYKVQYTASKLTLKPWSAGADSTYSQFGDFITAVTPNKFIAKFGMLGFQDDTTQDPNSFTNILQFLNSNIPDSDSIRFADFSGDASVSYQPTLYGRTNSDNLFEKGEINFIYFYFGLGYFFQEVSLPVEYLNVNLDQFNGNYANENYLSDSVKVNGILRVKHFPMIYPLFFPSTTGWPEMHVFGNCDSTFIFNREGAVQPISRNFPFGGSTILPVIRSNQYSVATIPMPGKDEDVSMVATLSFDTENLIQIYAGVDNLPYTSDDIFIYAPNYWERIKVKLDAE